jgi:hypothetical protein
VFFKPSTESLPPFPRIIQYFSIIGWGKGFLKTHFEKGYHFSFLNKDNLYPLKGVPRNSPCPPEDVKN